MNSLITPQSLTRILEQQQRQAVIKWVADPFGNHVKAFAVTLPEHSQIEYCGEVKNWGPKPYLVCLTIHDIKVAKSASRRAAKLPDGGVVLADGKWNWGAANALLEQGAEVNQAAV